MLYTEINLALGQSSSFFVIHKLTDALMIGHLPVENLGKREPLQYIKQETNPYYINPGIFEITQLIS